MDPVLAIGSIGVNWDPEEFEIYLNTDGDHPTYIDQP